MYIPLLIVLGIIQSDLFVTTTDVRTPVITGAAWVLAGNIITFDNVGSTVGIEVGMVINEFPAFKAGTAVVGVNGKYVTVNTNATTAAASSGSILFTSQ